MQWILFVITINAQSVTTTRFETERQCEEVKELLLKTFDANVKNEKFKPAIACYKLTTPKGL